MVGRELILRHQELIENPTTRVPVCLVLDASPSMGDRHRGDALTAIEELNTGVAAFYEAVAADPVARYAADVAVVSFSSDACVEYQFGSVGFGAPRIATRSGGTSLGTGVAAGLKLLDDRKHEYRETGVDYWQPWLVLMTDGAPTDDTHAAVAADVSARVAAKKLTIFPIGIGADADLHVLQRFSPGRPPLRLKGLNFEAFFQWLSKSVAAASQSTPDQGMSFDVGGIQAWGSL